MTSKRVRVILVSIAFLGWWPGFVWWIIYPVNVCKTFTTDFRAGNGSLVFCFTTKIDSFKRKKQCAVSCVGVRWVSGLIYIVTHYRMLWSGRDLQGRTIMPHYVT